MRRLVDLSNVMGARPDGWWRDRSGATERLLQALQRLAAGGDDEVVVVLDADPTGLARRSWDPLEVAVAERRGRDAADDAIVARLERDPDPGSWRVVTSDATLADRVRELGATVEGARSFRDRLDPPKPD
jgi:predicted RNA-binding protein with PIN domain